MRVIFFGTAEFAVPALERLARSPHQVVLCVTQPDRPQGRGLKYQPSPVKRSAQRLGLPLEQPQRLDPRVCEGRAADIGVVAAYGQLVPRDVLDRFPLGMVGVHPSLLPKYRGAAPVAWAILNGETRTGLTIFRMDERLDAGAILLQEPLAIEAREDAAALTARLAALGAELLVRALDAVAEGRVRPVPQDGSQASDAPKLTKAQGRIDWTRPAEVLERLVRGLSPWPGAVTGYRGQPLRIWRAEAASPASFASSREMRSISGTEPRKSLRDFSGRSEAGGGGGIRSSVPPGTIVRAGPDRLAVAVGGGILEVLELQPAGRRRQSVREFLAGHKVRPGDRLGDAA